MIRADQRRVVVLVVGVVQHMAQVVKLISGVAAAARYLRADRDDGRVDLLELGPNSVVAGGVGRAIVGLPGDPLVSICGLE